jgi:hypothetical protein
MHFDLLSALIGLVAGFILTMASIIVIAKIFEK